MKTYIKPKNKEKNVQPQRMIANSGDEPIHVGFYNNSSNGKDHDGSSSLGNSRRGSWGNL